MSNKKNKTQKTVEKFFVTMGDYDSVDHGLMFKSEEDAKNWVIAQIVDCEGLSLGEARASFEDNSGFHFTEIRDLELQESVPLPSLDLTKIMGKDVKVDSDLTKKLGALSKKDLVTLAGKLATIADDDGIL